MKVVASHIIVIYLLLSVTTIAQHPYSKKIDVEEENLTLKTNVLLKDNSGFLWIGTSEGLFKYNAVIPEKIHIPGEQKNQVTALHEDASGTIWAGCKTGQIFFIKNHTASFFTAAEGLPKVSVTAIYEDAKKRLWFATAGEGIFCFDGTHIYKINIADGLSDDNVNCLYSPDGNQIIAGTDRGISFITFEAGKKTVHFFSSKNGLPDNIVRCIIKSKQNDLVWVGMQSKGVLLFNIKKEQITDITATTNWRYSHY